MRTLPHSARSQALHTPTLPGQSRSAFIPFETGNKDCANRKVLRLPYSESPRDTLGSLEKIGKPLRRRTMAKADTHRWQFRARFRRGGFGWKSEPAIKRIKEAVSEIKKVARREQLLAAEG